MFSKIEQGQPPAIIVTTRAALAHPAPKRGAIKSATLDLRRGADFTMNSLLTALVNGHYERVAQVTTRGQFAIRGGIVDVFSWQATLPLRIEFFADEVESLREFDLNTQTAVRTCNRAQILIGNVEELTSRARDYIDRGDLIVRVEPQPGE